MAYKLSQISEESMAGIISAINLMDIVVISLTLLLLIFGIWRGMYKIVYGLISSIIALVLAITLTTPLVTFTIDNTLVDDKLTEVIAQPINKYVPNATQIVDFYDLDNNPDTPDELGFNPGTGARPFEDLLKDSKLKFMTTPFKSIVGKQVEKEGAMPFLNAAVAYIVTYILIIVAFLLLWLLCFLLIKLLFAVIRKLVTTTYIGYYINKIIGGLLGLVIGAVLIFGFLTIIKLMGNYPVIVSVNAKIDDSTITKMLANNNFVYNFVAGSIDVQSIIDKIMAMINRAGIS